jgi:type II secretory pathway pseudopilin PulG
LLVVIAIIGVLVALLLPAVQAAREAARRMSCGNNLKQFGLAMQNYHDSYKKFPPGGIHNVAGPWASSTSTSWGPSWAVMLLPYYEQSALHAQYDFKVQRSRDAPNTTVVTVELEVHQCPSDGSKDAKWVNSSAQFARGNYAVNAGRGNAFDQTQFRDFRKERGPFHLGAHYGAQMADIKDGTTNTILLTELLAGYRDTDVRGAWAYPTGVYISGGQVPSATPRIQLVPNGNALDDSLADRPTACSAETNDKQMRCGGGAASTNPGFQTARSYHPGGVQTCLADGSVRFVAETVDKTTWLNLLSQSDQQPLGPY